MFEEPWLFKKNLQQGNHSSHLPQHGNVEDSAAGPANGHEIPSLT